MRSNRLNLAETETFDGAPIAHPAKLEYSASYGKYDRNAAKAQVVDNYCPLKIMAGKRVAIIPIANKETMTIAKARFITQA